MDINNYLINPMITPAVVATIASVVVLILLVRSWPATKTRLANATTKLFTRSGLFWTVNLVFMAVSVLHAGIFFGITGNGHALVEARAFLGFAVSFFLDLVTIILMQAMLEARYRGEEGRARQFLLFIAVCCATSTFANLAISLNDFNASVMLPHAPPWVQVAAPYVLSCFPLFVIMMSVAAEMIVNVRPLESLDEQEYEESEKKRVKILQIRNTYLQRQADEELRTLMIRGQMRVNRQFRRGAMPGSFRWPWERPVDFDTVITGVTAQLKGMYEPQIEDLKRRLHQHAREVIEAETSTRHEAKHTGNRWPISMQEYRHKTTSNQDGTAALSDYAIAATEANSSKERDEEFGDASLNDHMPQGTPEETGDEDVPPTQGTHAMTYAMAEKNINDRKVKSLSVEDIVEMTGLSRQRVAYYATRAFARTKNPERFTVASVLTWLKTVLQP